MTLRVWPPAVALEPDARVLPAPLAATLANAGSITPVILLVAGSRAVETGWAAPAAIALAEAWSRDGPRIILADLSIGAPALDRLVGEPNDEGLADVFFYGASLGRVVRRSGTRGYGFIPAGSAPADSRDVLTDPGWRRVVARFFRDDEVMLAYAPASAAGLDALAARLGAVIALAAPGDVEELDAALPTDAAVLACLEPSAPAASGRPPEQTGGEPAAEPFLAWEAEAEQEPPEPFLAWEPEPARQPPETVLAWEPQLPEVPQAAGPAAEAGDAAPEVAGPVTPEEGTAAPLEEGAYRVEEAPASAGPPSAPGEPAGGPGATAGRPEGARPGEPVSPGPRYPSEPAAMAAERERRARIPSDPREALVEALWARRTGGPGRAGAAPPVDPVAGRSLTETELLAEPPVAAPEQPERRRGLRLVLWVLLAVVVAVGILIAVRLFMGADWPYPNWLGRSGLDRAAPSSGALPGAAAQRDSAAVASADSAARPALPPDSLPFSVAIEAYPQYASAVERAAALRRQQPGSGFFVTPMLDRGAIYYHVMAGPVADSVAARALMQHLLRTGVKTGASQWDIVETPLAFLLGDFDSRGAAERRAATLARQAIPTYMVSVTPAGGSSSWRLYAGAFQGAADANVLRPVLKGAGVADSLVLRTGRAGNSPP